MEGKREGSNKQGKDYRVGEMVGKWKIMTGVDKGFEHFLHISV